MIAVHARAVLALLLAVALVAGCASPQRRQQYTSSLDETSIEQLDEPAPDEIGDFELVQYTWDPIEPVNRASLWITRPFLEWLLVPLARGWRWLTPRAVRQGLDNFRYNLGFPVRFVGLLLQGEIVKSGTETGHFLVNTTAGIGGFLDASDYFGIPTYSEDVGQAVGSWGVGPGPYFFMPLGGPTNARDFPTGIINSALRISTWLPGINILLRINSLSRRGHSWEALRSSTPDVYTPLRAYSSISREMRVQNFELTEEDFAEADPEPSLGVIALELSNPDFAKAGDRHAAQAFGTDRQVRYQLWLQDQPAEIVYILPGIGGFRRSAVVVALAEMAFERGLSVASISGPFHAEFIRHTATHVYPGYSPRDSEDIYAALRGIDGDVRRRNPGRVTSANLIGFSLGGLEAIFVAGQEAKAGPSALTFDHIIAVNPPVEMDEAADRMDAYYQAPLAWDESERDQRIEQMIFKSVLVARNGVPEGKPLPFDRIESKFMVGLNGRTTLVNALLSIRRRGGQRMSAPEGAPRGLFGLMEGRTYRRYADELLIPDLTEQGLGSDAVALWESASLTSQRDFIASDRRIRIITAADDFLLDDEDLVWLRETAGDRLNLFPGGGHLGGLLTPEVQEPIFVDFGVQRIR